MINASYKEEPVASSLVGENNRMDILPRYFQSYLFAETAIYETLSKLCEEYNGGYWEFFELSNGGFFMAPAGDKELSICVASNYFSEKLSPNATGVAVCLMVFSNLSFHDQSDHFTNLFHYLREFALDHKEASLIFKAID